MLDRILERTRNAGAPLLMALALGVGAASQNLMAQATQHYTQTNLVSNLASLAPKVDPNLVNAWGLSRSSKSPWWVSDNGPGLATLYTGTGVTQSLVVTIPPGSTDSTTGTPTGTVFNGDSTAFLLAPGKAAAFLFVTEDGTISGWNPGVAATSAVIVVNQKDSVFKGMTIAVADLGKGPLSYLYVADFRKGQVEVFDPSFKPVYLSGDSFDDDRLPHGFAPFNVQNIGGNLYVAFAKQGKGKHDEQDGAGLGYVDVFSPEGKLLRRLESGWWFNAPWGLALGSSDFGSHSHDVLVGQFGSGQILAFDAVTGKFTGALLNTAGTPIVIDGLWAIMFGNDASAGLATTLYFTAGPDGESNGLFGMLTAVENVQGGAR
jgi:uncharacterized protein (TIGR03118 family)